MKTVGILGGMGPAATVDLFDRIVRATPARRDQEHLSILIVNDPTIPDRTQAILHGGPDPRPAMRRDLDLLVGMGAELLAMPCNTAHHYWGDLQAGLDVPLVNMVDETVRAIQRCHPGIHQVGVMATSSTLAVRLFQDALEGAGLFPVEPVGREVAQLMEAIYGPQGVKAGHRAGLAQRLFQQVGQALIERGAQALILGCTEIPLALHDDDLPAPLLISTQALAEAVVREATSREAMAAVPVS